MNTTLFRHALLLLVVIALLSACGSSKPAATRALEIAPKREFRGAWVQTVGQTRYQQMSSADMRYYFTEMVRKFDEAGINAIIFQVRPEGDAFYISNLEPWSRFLTGEQGVAPDDPSFDPMTFLIEECHKRGIEFHAWLNPYRVKTNLENQLASKHIYWSYPHRFVEYGNQLYFDPGVPENRRFVCEVVRDIVSRYDVDAIHMDDYFYPYPIAGQQFPDDRSFSMFAPSQGFSASQRDDWRRNNVNSLVRELKYTIAAVKPWVRFGISPFGIYRNRRSTPDGSGSDTSGLQNYDDLYADVKKWVKEGWIDYNMPQLYWEIGHSAADYNILLEWWNENNFGETLYIGQDIQRSINRNELQRKIHQSRKMSFVSGNCYWFGYQILENADVADMLRNDIHRAKSIPPAYTHMHNKLPKAVGKVVEEFTKDSHFIRWASNKKEGDPETAQNFVIYRFRKGEKVNINRAENIVAVTPNSFYVLPYEGGGREYTYVVTALDGFKNESKKGMRIRVRL